MAAQNEQAGLDEDSSSASGQMTRQGLELQLRDVRAQNLSLQQELLGLAPGQAASAPAPVATGHVGNPFDGGPAPLRLDQPSPSISTAAHQAGGGAGDESAADLAPLPMFSRVTSTVDGVDDGQEDISTPSVAPRTSTPLQDHVPLPAATWLVTSDSSSLGSDIAMSGVVPAEEARCQPEAAPVATAAAGPSGSDVRMTSEQIREAVARRKQALVSSYSVASRYCVAVRSCLMRTCVPSSSSRDGSDLNLSARLTHCPCLM